MADELRKVIPHTPDDPNAYISLGVVLKRLGRHADAVANFQKALELKAGADVHRLLAESLETLGRLEESRRHREILRPGPGRSAQGTWWSPVTLPAARLGLALCLACAAAAAALQGQQRGGARPPAEGPPPQFQDVTEQARLDFQHTNGASPDKHMVETMGSGGLFFDYDNDGWLDIFLVDGGSLADRRWSPAARGTACTATAATARSRT